MIFIVSYKSEDGKNNRVALVNAPNYSRAMDLLGLDLTHKDWAIYYSKEIKTLLKVKEAVIDKQLSVNR